MKMKFIKMMMKLIDGLKLMVKNGEKLGLIKSKKCQGTVMKQEKSLNRLLININYLIRLFKVANKIIRMPQRKYKE